jgi:hypothetical protein
MSITDHYDRHVQIYSDIHEHLPTLKKYASECEHVTEMGVRNVISTWAFLAAKPKRLVCIDIKPCPVEEAAQLAKDAEIDFQFIQADTTDPLLDIEPTDLLFIDTWHVYMQLKTEFQLHCNKVKKYIILHDTTAFGEVGESLVSGFVYKGLWYAVEEFLNTNPEWVLKERYTNCNGLTILQRK